jgi:antitoxin PrlF
LRPLESSTPNGGLAFLAAYRVDLRTIHLSHASCRPDGTEGDHLPRKRRGLGAALDRSAGAATVTAGPLAHGPIPYYNRDRKDNGGTMTGDATLTSKGQTTIPKAIRDTLAMKPGDRLTFTLMTDGTVVMRVKNKRVMDLAGTLRRKGRKAVPIEQLSR